MPNDPPLFASACGLSEADVQARLKIEGYNELPRTGRRTPLRIILEVLREPMLALLLGGGVIYLALGDPKEAVILLAFATMSVLITVVQETRTERVLEALRDLTSPRALVIRDGLRKRIAGREVVRGDSIVLAEGDRIPADAVLVQSHDLQTDESLLTGESVPVRKIASGKVPPSKGRRPGGDELPYVYSGSLVVRGTGIGEVIAIGALSEIGKIGQSLSTLETEPPRLQAQTRRLVRVFAMVGGTVSVLAVLLYGTMRGGWLDAVLAGIALGMSMLPEEFPVVLTVFMAMGAWRISRARVLTRRAAAIETLGSATVLCTDKTGTLTENRMSIVELRLKTGEIFRPREVSGAKMPEDFHHLVEFGLLASARDPFDPMTGGAGRCLLQSTRHRGAVDQGRQERRQVDEAVMLLVCSQRCPASVALAYNLANFMRTLALPEAVKQWSLTSLKEKLIKIGAKVVCHGRYVIFQMVEVAVPKELFQEILRLIDGLRPRPAPA